MFRTIPLLVLLCVADAASAAPDFAGRPQRIHDGDTLRLADVSIRLWGIDAPELKQRCQDGAGKGYSCGAAARDALVALIDGRPVTCHKRDLDRFGRIVAACSAGRTDLNEEMVRRGWAVAYRSITKSFVSAEAEARNRGVGIWSGRFQNPADWRREHR